MKSNAKKSEQTKTNDTEEKEEVMYYFWHVTNIKKILWYITSMLFLFRIFSESFAGPLNNHMYKARNSVSGNGFLEKSLILNKVMTKFDSALNH